MMRLYYVAHKLLNPNEFLKTVLSYEGKSPELLVSIRLGWPYRWKIEIENLSRDASFWHGISDYLWAQTWWRESLRGGTARDIKAPTHFQQRLVELFATYPYNGMYISSRKPFIESETKLAIWRMVRYQQMVQYIGELSQSIDNPYKSKLLDDFISISNDEFNLDYVGLDEAFNIIIREIIQLSHVLLLAYSKNDEKRRAQTLREYINKIREYLQLPGLGSWVACRCAINIIQGFGTARNEYSQLVMFQSTNEGKLINSLIEDVRLFYDYSYDDDNHSDKNENTSLSRFAQIITRHRSPLFFSTESNPKCIRLESGDNPIYLVDLLADSINNDHDLPFKWVEEMPLSSELIRHLLDKCKDCLPKLLSVIGKSQFSNANTTPLRIQSTQRILKIARSTNDQVILTGITYSLANANFLRIVDLDTILKLLHVDSLILLSSKVFVLYKDNKEDKDPEIISKEIGFIEEIARNVLGRPEFFPFQTVCLASDFLAEHHQIKLLPLLYEEERLGVKLLTS